jgi:hypothetical protein
MLDRINPAVDRLITHVQNHSDYRQPGIAADRAGAEAGK